MDPDRVVIFDTTLRDGEQSPGISLNTTEKLEIAHQLARLGVDVIEAGFPIASPRRLRGRPGDRPRGRTARSSPAWRELMPPTSSVPPRRCATRSDLGSTRSSPRRTSTSSTSCSPRARTSRAPARAAVAHAKSFVDDVEFSPMDATRADVEFTAEVLQIALDEGATTINIPDTVGYATPDEYAAFLTRLYELVPDLRGAVLSDPLPRRPGPGGRELAGRRAGGRAPGRVRDQRHRRARGQRVARGDRDAAAHARGRPRASRPAIKTREIARTSRMVSRLTGYPVQPNKAIVGRNAFAHESGIHQDGVLKDRTTYEIMDATTVGLEGNDLVLGKHSGRHALKSALAELGFEVDGQALNTAFKRFKELADRKKQVTAMDLEALVTDELRDELRSYTLEWFDVDVSNRRPPHARGRDPHAGRRGGARRLHRRRPGRRDLPRDQRRHEARGAAARVPHRRRHRRPGRARRGERRARARGPVRRRARASRPTSSRRPPRPTCARSPTRSARCTRPRPSTSRRSSSRARRSRAQLPARSPWRRRRTAHAG